MTIYSILLARGYFPKELPPSFYTEDFARFATTRVGRATVTNYKPQDGFTECVDYQLALSGGHRRGLSIPHPHSYAKLSQLVAKNLKRLLTKAGVSPFAKSRPVYTDKGARAFQTLVRPGNTGREKASARGAARVLLKADVNQFYPSLYTHAVGWAVDPKLREKINWHKKGLLGKQIDQALMDCQGKRSQGLPVGPDISNLLAEIVLSQVDREVKTSASASYRWVDDYEFGCRSHQEAEALLSRLERALKRFNLRLSPTKTRIIEAASRIHDPWQLALQTASQQQTGTASSLLRFFDLAFGFRRTHPDAPVMNYACASLFTLGHPTNEHAARVAQSCLSQVVLAEPGASQKAFALLSFWVVNGMKLESSLVARTATEMALAQQHRGLSSDVTWALAFCLRHGVALEKRAAAALCESNDDCVCLQALDLRDRKLAPGMTVGRLKDTLRRADLDGAHWLLAYEAVRQGFIPVGRRQVERHGFFGPLLAADVSFYRRKLPDYAEIVHPGGAPDWVVKGRLKSLQDDKSETVARMVSTDVAAVPKGAQTGADLLLKLLDRLSASAETDELASGSRAWY